MVEGFIFSQEGEPCPWCTELVLKTGQVMPESQEDEWSITMEYGVSTTVWSQIFG